MTAEEYNVRIKYLAAKAKRQGGTLTLQEAIEFHEAAIMQLTDEMLNQAQEIGTLKSKVRELEEKHPR